jgi:glutathione S-transferase
LPGVAAGMTKSASVVRGEAGSEAMLKIHNFARGVRGLRVMWLCEEMGLAYVVENHAFPTPAAYRALNPLGTVPLIEDGGGIALNESIAIMLYLAQIYGPSPLLPVSDPASLARCLQLTLFGETELGMSLNPLLAARFGAGEADKRNWSVIGLEQRAARAIQYAQGLIKDRAFFVGDQLTLADISVSCGLALWQGGLAGGLPKELEHYQDRIGTRPAYQRARQRCASGDAPSARP